MTRLVRDEFARQEKGLGPEFRRTTNLQVIAKGTNPLRHGDLKSVDLKSPSFKSGCVTSNHSRRRLSVADVLIQFGEHLRRVRMRRKVSQERLAELAGLHRTYVSSVERGLRNISLLNIDKLARALDVPLTSLMPRPH